MTTLSPYCQFAPCNVSPAPLWECVVCGFRTHKGLGKPPSRRCPGVRRGRQLDEGRHWATCQYRGRTLATIAKSTAGCGCASGQTDVYRCEFFSEPVLKVAAARCLDRIREVEPAYTGRTCRPCTVPLVDPISLLHVTHRERWQDHVRRSLFAFRGAGLSIWASELVKPTLAVLRQRIDETRPRIVVVHACSVPSAWIVELARQYRDVVFVAVDHSTLNHTFTWPHYFEESRVVLEASRTASNIFVSAVDRFTSWRHLGYNRFFWWPNPLYVPAVRDPLPVDPPTVILSGRVDWMKGWPAQITAAALVQRRRPLRVMVSLGLASPPREAGLRSHVAATGVRCQFLPYGSFDVWYQRLREEVSVVLQPSMSDSFNIVTAEAAIHGRPFVGSTAIRHTPRAWCVQNPNDTAAIAAVLEFILDHYPEQSALAARIGAELVAANNAAYCAAVTSLLSRQTPDLDSDPLPDPLWSLP